MKKFFPVIILSFVFTMLVVSQMVINGEELSASRLDKNKEKYALFESEFSKLKVSTTKGSEIEFSKVEKPVVIVNFWASWCQPCVREFQSLNKLLGEYDKKIMVVGVNNDSEDALKKIKKAEAKYGLKFESISDVKSEMASKFNISRIPSTIVFHKGKVIKFADKEFNFMDPEFVKTIKNL